MKLDVIYSGLYYDDCHPFDALCANVDNVKAPDEIKERNSALIIWGGSDIHPDLYKRPMHSTTHPGGMRDKCEWGLVQRAIEMQIPIFGVCRGAQMLCAAAGGWLIQNVYGHAGHGGHDVVTKDDHTFRVNSIHHQMMAGLEKTDHELIAWSPVRRSEEFLREDSVPYGIDRDESWIPPQGWNEPEFVYFPKINGYAIQWHPEAMAGNSAATQYVLQFIEKKETARGSHTFPVCAC